MTDEEAQALEITCADQRVFLKELRGRVAELEVAEREADTVLLVLRELVAAVDEREDGLDPTDRLVRAMREARSWVSPVVK